MIVRADCILRGGLCLVHDHSEEAVQEIAGRLCDAVRKAAEEREQRIWDAILSEDE